MAKSQGVSPLIPVEDDVSSLPSSSHTDTVVSFDRTVHHNGNTYFSTSEMAEIFHSNAEQIVARGETELVPLLHSSGIELLLISPTTVFAVVTIEVGSHKTV